MHEKREKIAFNAINDVSFIFKVWWHLIVFIDKKFAQRCIVDRRRGYIVLSDVVSDKTSLSIFLGG